MREAGLKVCCGGIVGMGETTTDRASMLITLANLPAHPESVPINQLVQVPGTPLHGKTGVDPFDFVRTIAVARIMMPAAHVRLSAGREAMSDELQALCFMAGANSMFYGEKLLTTGNPDVARDQQLFVRLGLKPEENNAPDNKVTGPPHAHTNCIPDRLAPALTRLELTHVKRSPAASGRRSPRSIASTCGDASDTVEAFPVEGTAPKSSCEGKRLIDFCSNDYLGLARHPEDRGGAQRGGRDLRLRQRRRASRHRARQRARQRSKRARGVHRTRAGAAVLHRLHGESRRHLHAGRTRRSRAAGPAEPRLR